MDSVMREDSKRICELPFIPWEDFSGKTILITGSTGLIGLNLVNAIRYANTQRSLGLTILLPVRNTEAARSMFGEDVKVFSYQLGAPLSIEGNVDYIVHLASPTSSRFFTERPVDTLLSNIEGTKAILELAREKAAKKVICVSTMEVYGLPQKGHIVSENEVGAFEPMNARNSYPIAKIACEALCYAEYSQYGTPAVILRATQTFGPGVKPDDNRVFAQFMRCAAEKKDIVLKSKGETERAYLYTADAVSAILTALVKGVPGEAYTVANPDTYCSIREMAEMVASDLAGGSIEVKFDIAEDITKLGYAETLYMNLNTEKLGALGWQPQVGLLEAYQRMMRSALPQEG